MWPPQRAHRIGAEGPPTCWRGCDAPGTFAHLWWECTKVQPYWERILAATYQITGEQIQKNPWDCIFHDTRKAAPQYTNTLVPFLLSAAKSLIPSLWRSQEVLSLKDWVARVEMITVIEETIHIEEDSLERFWNLWGKWWEFRKSGTWRHWWGCREARREGIREEGMGFFLFFVGGLRGVGGING